MRRSLRNLTLAALPALLFAAARARAGVVYIPVIDPAASAAVTQETKLFLANTGAAERSATTFFLDDNTDGTKRTGTRGKITVPGGRTLAVVGLGQSGADRLLELDAHPLVAVEAFLVRSAVGAAPALISLPVVSSARLLPSGSIAYVLGLGRDDGSGVASDLGVLNLGSKSASCEIRFLSSSGVQLAPTAVLSFPPLSQRYFRDALGTIGQSQLGDARAQVTCSQQFFAFGLLYSKTGTSAVVLEPSETGASTLTVPGDGGGEEPPTGNTFTLSGLVHRATTGSPKRIVKVPFDATTRVRQLIIDMEFTPGPWNTEKDEANHAILWAHLGKFRSQTVANVNAFAPPRSTIKSAQNVSLPRGGQTDQFKSIALVQGDTYRLLYTYDAESGKVTAVVSRGGTVLLTLQHAATASNGRLEIPSTGLVLEFGHNAGQEGPEVPSYGWEYGNVKVEWTT